MINRNKEDRQSRGAEKRAAVFCSPRKGTIPVGSSLEPEPETETDDHVMRLYNLPEEETIPLAAEPSSSRTV